MIRLFRLGFSLVLLVVLLVVADRLAARVAGQVVADRIKASQHLTTTPKVSVKGFPFLTQLWRATMTRSTPALSTSPTGTSGRPR